jgi:hypothetical protein
MCGQGQGLWGLWHAVRASVAQPPSLYLQAAGTLRLAMSVRESLQTRPDLAGTALDHLDSSEGRLAIHVSVGTSWLRRQPAAHVPHDPHRNARIPVVLNCAWYSVSHTAAPWLLASKCLLVVPTPSLLVLYDLRFYQLRFVGRKIPFRSCHWRQKRVLWNILRISMITKY